MKILALAPLAFGFLVLGASAAADEQRPPLKSVSALRVGNYGSPSVMIEARDQVQQIIGELNALRRKAWRQGDTRLTCYATLVLLEKGKPAGLFRIGRDFVVERQSGKGQTSFSLAVAEGDMPRLTKLLAEIKAPKCD